MILEAYKIILRSKRLLPINAALSAVAIGLLVLGFLTGKPWWFFMLNSVNFLVNASVVMFVLTTSKRQIVLLAKGMR